MMLSPGSRAGQSIDKLAQYPPGILTFVSLAANLTITTTAWTNFLWDTINRDDVGAAIKGSAVLIVPAWAKWARGTFASNWQSGGSASARGSRIDFGSNMDLAVDTKFNETNRRWTGR